MTNGDIQRSVYRKLLLTVGLMIGGAVSVAAEKDAITQSIQFPLQEQSLHCRPFPGSLDQENGIWNIVFRWSSLGEENLSLIPSDLRKDLPTYPISHRAFMGRNDCYQAFEPILESARANGGYVDATLVLETEHVPPLRHAVSVVCENPWASSRGFCRLIEEPSNLVGPVKLGADLGDA